MVILLVEALLQILEICLGALNFLWGFSASLKHQIKNQKPRKLCDKTHTQNRIKSPKLKVKN